jgi:hypothetical protein
MALKPGNLSARQKIDEMPVHKMTFVLVNSMAPRMSLVCGGCSRLLECRHLHDLSSSNRDCGIECYLQRPAVRGFDGSIALTNSFELGFVWSKLSVDVAFALFENAWRDHGG